MSSGASPSSHANSVYGYHCELCGSCMRIFRVCGARSSPTDLICWPGLGAVRGLAASFAVFWNYLHCRTAVVQHLVTITQFGVKHPFWPAATNGLSRASKPYLWHNCGKNLSYTEGHQSQHGSTYPSPPNCAALLFSYLFALGNLMVLLNCKQHILLT